MESFMRIPLLLVLQCDLQTQDCQDFDSERWGVGEDESCESAWDSWVTEGKNKLEQTVSIWMQVFVAQGSRLCPLKLHSTPVKGWSSMLLPQNDSLWMFAIYYHLIFPDSCIWCIILYHLYSRLLISKLWSIWIPRPRMKWRNVRVLVANHDAWREETALPQLYYSKLPDGIETMFLASI